jgi:signal transduction histidine kinase
MHTVSALLQTVEVPAEQPIEYVLAYDAATAADIGSALAGILARARLESGAARVEWWEDEDFVAADGLGSGVRRRLDLAGVGAFVFHGGRLESELTAALEGLAPLLRRLQAAEALAIKAGELVRRNQALEEFAGFVAHELRTPLHEALLADDASQPVHEALELVDSLLRTVRDVRPAADGLGPAECVESVVRTLGARAAGLQVTTALAASLPITVGALCIILRNFLTNAVSAGAEHVHVSSVDSRELVVDDDGIGMTGDGYQSGSGLGLELCRRVAETFGARIELLPRRLGGTRARLVFGGS